MEIYHYAKDVVWSGNEGRSYEGFYFRFFPFFPDDFGDARELDERAEVSTSLAEAIVEVGPSPSCEVASDELGTEE